jgi:hypothetical protein
MILSVSSSVTETNGIPSCGCFPLRNRILQLLKNNRSQESQDDIVEVVRRKETDEGIPPN